MRNQIKTDRLVLRPLHLDDAPAFSKLAGEFDIARMTGSIPYPFPPLAAEFKIMDMRQQRYRGLAYPYAITRDGKDLMGIVDLFRPTPDSDLELGYWLGHPFQSQGYMTEACQAILLEAQTRLGVTKFVAGVFHDNPASVHVLEKLGFKRLDINERYFSMARTAYADSLQFELDSADIPPTRTRPAQRIASPLRQTVKTVINA